MNSCVLCKADGRGRPRGSPSVAVHNHWPLFITEFSDMHAKLVPFASVLLSTLAAVAHTKV